MGFINSEDHFFNYMNKIFRDNDDVDADKLLDKETYIDLIYKPKLTDQYTWAVKNDPMLLEGENLLKWLQRNKCLGTAWPQSAFEHSLTAEFSNELKNLSGVPGVYSFWTKSGTPLYVGVSHNLQERVLSSFSERFNKYKKEVYFRYIRAETATDAAVLEVYFIGKLKPALNGASKYGDELTLEIKDVPEFSNGILCNRLRRKAK
jgi:hypothetical protein